MTARLFSEDALVFDSATLDLTSLGLANLPMPRHFSNFRATLTVPETAPPGEYTVRVLVQDRGRQHQATATLLVTRGPLVVSVAFQPEKLMAGQATTLTAVITTLEGSIASVWADLSAFGLSPATPLARVEGDTYSLAFAVPAGAGEGSYYLPVRAVDSAGRTATRAVPLE